VLCFVLALQLTKHHHWLTRPLRIALWAFGVLTCAVVLTNELHHWFWQSIRLVPGLPETATDKGPLFWAYAALLYVFTLTTVALYFRYCRATTGYFRRQASLMALAGFVPLARIPISAQTLRRISALSAEAPLKLPIVAAAGTGYRAEREEWRPAWDVVCCLLYTINSARMHTP
jgi:hypothetical protein